VKFDGALADGESAPGFFARAAGEDESEDLALSWGQSFATRE
jgi:hypothetical protein